LAHIVQYISLDNVYMQELLQEPVHSLWLVRLIAWVYAAKTP